MLKGLTNNITYSKFNILKYVLKRLLCLFLRIKYAVISCVLDFFCTIELHCRSPPKFISKNLKWIGGRTVQYEVDSYTLEYIEDEDKYYISFVDSAEQDCRIQIDKEIFDTYMKSKKAYTKIKNETSRYLEHSSLTDEEIYKRAFDPVESVEETVIKNIERKKVNQAMQNLTEVQYRRIDLHIVNEITIRDLAKIEMVQKKQIEKSLQLGLKKIKKFFEK